MHRLIFSFLLLMAQAAEANVLTVNPETANATILTAQEGDVVNFEQPPMAEPYVSTDIASKLSVPAGYYGVVNVKGKSGLTFNLGRASLQMVMINSHNITINGGVFYAPRTADPHDAAPNISFFARKTTNLHITDATFQGSVDGFTGTDLDGLQIRNTLCVGLRANCIFFGRGNDIVISGVTCKEWSGTIYWTVPGQRGFYGDHPDCVQLGNWQPGKIYPPMKRILVENVHMIGRAGVPFDQNPDGGPHPVGPQEPTSQGVFINLTEYPFEDVTIRNVVCTETKWGWCVYVGPLSVRTHVSNVRATGFLKPDGTRFTVGVNMAKCHDCTATNTVPKAIWTEFKPGVQAEH